MRTQDPFLRHLLAAVDRAFVWSVLAVVLTALAWTAVWERGLGQPAVDGWHVLALTLLGHDVDRTTLTLFLLCAALGAASATLIGGWMFRRWRRRADLDVRRIRGTRWEGEQ